MTRDEAIEDLRGFYAQLYDPFTGRKMALSAKKYDAIYDGYEEIDKDYEFSLGEEECPEYGEDELNDLLDEVGAALV